MSEFCHASSLTWAHAYTLTCPGEPINVEHQGVCSTSCYRSRGNESTCVYYSRVQYQRVIVILSCSRGSPNRSNFMNGQVTHTQPHTITACCSLLRHLNCDDCLKYTIREKIIRTVLWCICTALVPNLTHSTGDQWYGGYYGLGFARACQLSYG